MEADIGFPLTDRQRAAAAKVACVVARPGGVAVVCGPRGVGKTAVLVAAVADHAAGGVEWLRPVDGGIEPPPGEPAVVVVDDAHEAETTGLARLVAACRSRRMPTSLVLAGEGRLLTLLARDPRLERAVDLRAVVHPFSFAETHAVLTELLGDSAASAPLAQTMQEITAGIPAEVVRLAEFARLLPADQLTGAAVEAFHRRLSLQAA